MTNRRGGETGNNTGTMAESNNPYMGGERR